MGDFRWFRVMSAATRLRQSEFIPKNKYIILTEECVKRDSELMQTWSFCCMLHHYTVASDIKQGSVLTMAQATNKPDVDPLSSGNVETKFHAAPVGLDRNLRFGFMAYNDPSDGVTMKFLNTKNHVMFLLQPTGVGRELELVDAADGSIISVIRPTEGSVPSQWTGYSSSGQANGAGGKLLTLTKTRVINRHTDINVMTMKSLGEHGSFGSPPMQAGVAYKIIGSWSNRSIVVREVDTTTVIAEMSPGADKDSFVVKVHPDANTVFVVLVFAIAKAMKDIGTFDGASFSFGLKVAGHILAGVAYDAIAACVGGDACAEGGCACCCCWTVFVHSTLSHTG